MKKLYIIFLLFFGIYQISAQDNVFSYTFSENIVTQNEDNTKAVNVNRILLNQIIFENSNYFLLKIPLIDESFLNVRMKKFSVLSPEHNLLIETSNGQELEEYFPNFQSFYIYYFIRFK